MTRSYRYLHLDVFTNRLFGGNQLAVFLDGRGLPPETMQAIAKEMNFSESTFVLPPDRTGTDFQVRIFTPEEELPMAGHPAVGTIFALARAGVLGPQHVRVTFSLGVGSTPMSLVWRGSELVFVWMTQLTPTFGAAVPNPVGLAASLGVASDAFTKTALPVQTVSCGVPYLCVPLASRASVDQAGLDSASYNAFCRTAGVPPGTAVFPFSLEPDEDGATAYGRMFAPGLGIREDPATGSAAGPLGCYLVRHRKVTSVKAAEIVIRQGVKMGRPSHLHVAIDVEDNEVKRVRVGGEAVVAGEGTLYL
jgi:trans-2,3-dihydro-3-hydroxyanthranilate isomerase